MSPRTFVARSAALFALAALGLAACESKTVVQPAQFPLQIAVTPSSLSFTKAGDKATMVATLTGGDAGQATAGVTWASSNTAVATVDANGVVTAVANGTTTITATSKAVPTLQAAAVVTVNIPVVTPPTPPAAPTVSIQSITDNAGNNVDITNTAGQINVALNVDVPAGNTIQSVNVLVDGVVQCSQTFSTGNAGVGVEAANAVTIVCPINTLKLNANGTPVFANGPHTITATLVAPGGTVKAQTSQTLTFNNGSGLGVSLSAAKQAADPAGLVWNDSTVTVTVTPTIFSSAQLQSITVQLAGVATAQTKAVTSNAPVTFTFRADTAGGVGTLGLTNAALTATATAITTAGNPFSTLGFTSAGLRYDNAGPTFSVQPDLTTLAPNGFMNAAAVLSLGKFNAVVADAGVDSVNTFVQTSTDGGTTWTNATTVAALTEQPAGTFIARIAACDKLGNCSFSNATAAFGVDLTPPPVVSVAADTINPVGAAVTFTLGLDNLSGFIPGNLLQVQVIQDAASATGADVTKCVTDLTLGTTTTVPTGGCPFLTVATNTITIPAAAGAGYYTITAFSQDLAGNKTASTTKVALVDVTAPTIAITSRGLTGNIPTVTGSIKDNVDLKSYQPWAQFAGVIGGTTVTNLPMAAATTVGAFGLPITAVATPTATLPFGSIESGLGTAVIDQLANVGFTATDVAGNAAALTVASLISAGVGVTATDITAFGVAASPTTICKSGVTSGACTAPTPDVTATSTTLTATVTMANDILAGPPPVGTACATVGSCAANPIVAVYFYSVNGLNAAFLGSTTTSTFGVNTANLRVYTFTASGAASAMLTGANTVFAIGVDANGNGVFMGTVAVTTL